METPAPTPVSSGCEQYRGILAQYDWDVNIAMAVMRVESTQNGIICNPNADNTGLNQDGTNDKGLMQINSIHVATGLISDEARFDPEQNIKAAYSIYLGQLNRSGDGWKAWSSYNQGKHLRYL